MLQDKDNPNNRSINGFLAKKRRLDFASWRTNHDNDNTNHYDRISWTQSNICVRSYVRSVDQRNRCKWSLKLILEWIRPLFSLSILRFLFIIQVVLCFIASDVCYVHIYDQQELRNLFIFSLILLSESASWCDNLFL
jgi:hypothetical protein